MTYDRETVFVTGRKPTELAGCARISKRRWAQHERGETLVNAIEIGQRYLKVFELESVQTYADAAEVLGVSRVRVYQHVALVTKLPARITRFLLGSEDRAVIRFFSERRLRPLTSLNEDEAKCREFESLLRKCEESG